MGYIVLQCDPNTNVHGLEYWSKTSKRVVSLIMAGEVSAFPDAFNATMFLAFCLSTYSDVAFVFSFLQIRSNSPIRLLVARERREKAND